MSDTEYPLSEKDRNGTSAQDNINAKLVKGGHKARSILVTFLALIVLSGVIVSAVFGYQYWKEQNNLDLGSMTSEVEDCAVSETEDTSELTTGNILSDSEVEAITNYEEVNDSLTGIVTSEEYLGLETAEKAEQVIAILEQLEDEQKIVTGSIKYDETAQMVSYQYADGSYGGILLEDFAEGTSGAGEESYGTSINYNEEEDVWEIASYASIPSFNTENYPYLEKELNALIVCNLGDGYENSVTMSQLIEEQWTDAYLQTTFENNDTTEFYRSGLDGYDLIVVQEHGIIYEDKTCVVLQESTSWGVYLMKEAGLAYTYVEELFLQDFQENRIAMICLSDGKYHTCLMPSFFTYYYGDDGLEDSIVWLGCCSGYRNDYLVEAFAACGAKSVLGATDTVSTDYNFFLMDAFVYMLLYGNTVDEALDFAQSVWGENDAVFLSMYTNIDDDTPAEVRYYNGKSETLVTLEAEVLAEIEKESLSDENDILTEKLDELATKYGVFDSEQTGRMTWVTDEWFCAEGIMSATILDFDSDGNLEMMVCIAEVCGHYEDSDYSHIMMYMWEVEGGEAVLSDSMLFAAYIQNDRYNTEQLEELLTPSYWSEEILTANTLYIDGNYMIFCESHSVAWVYADGSDRNYWMLEYVDGEFQYVCSFTQTDGGSDGFEHTGYMFDDGICISAELYYTEWYDDIDDALYDNYGEAIKAFFEEYGVEIAEDISDYDYADSDYDNFDSILSSDSESILLFELTNSCLDYSWESNSTRASFKTVLGRGNELLDGYDVNTISYETVSGSNGTYSISEYDITDLQYTLVGEWTDGNTGYYFYEGGTYEWENVTIRNGDVTNRYTVDTGYVEITAINGANLLLDHSSGGSWLIYDSDTETIFIGNNNHPYYRMENWLVGITPEVTAPEIQIPEGNTYGNNIVWTITDGLLEAHGTGKMMDYVGTYYVPWYSERSKVTEVIMRGNIINVGNYAFDGFNTLNSVVLPESIKTIGEYAFWGCVNLESITIPANVTEIGNYAFRYCNDLTDVNYTGTEAQWNQISIGYGNDCLTEAEIHYNAVE